MLILELPIIFKLSKILEAIKMFMLNKVGIIGGVLLFTHTHTQKDTAFYSFDFCLYFMMLMFSSSRK